MSFITELAHLRESGAPRDALEVFHCKVALAIGELKANARVRQREQADLRSRIEALETERQTFSQIGDLRNQSQCDLLEALDPDAYARWLSEAALMEEAIRTPERLVDQLARLRTFVCQLADGSPRLKEFLALPFDDPNYRTELESVVALDHKLRETLSNSRLRT